MFAPSPVLLRSLRVVAPRIRAGGRSGTADRVADGPCPSARGLLILRLHVPDDRPPQLFFAAQKCACLLRRQVARTLANLPPSGAQLGTPPGRGTGQQPRPGLVVIQNRDGSQVDVVSPPPAPMIEHDPLAGQMGNLEPQGPRN
jgi:hypothetical protein